MGSSSSSANNESAANNQPQEYNNFSSDNINLDHLTQNARYQQILRDIYSNNSGIPFIPGAFIMENFGYDTILNPPNIRLKRTSPITNEFLIHKDSVKLIKDELDKNIYHLTFKFNSKAEGEVYIHFDSREILDVDKNLQMIVNDEQQSGIKSEKFTFNKGKSIQYPTERNSINIKIVPEDHLLKAQNDKYPIIIEMATKTEILICKKKYLMYCTLNKDSSGEYTVKIVKQKFHFNEKTYELMSIYDTSNEDMNNDPSNKDKKECSICLTNPIDTVVSPCNHLCLCYYCAKNLKSHNSSKCPICRKNVETFVKMEKKINKKEENNNDDI